MFPEYAKKAEEAGIDAQIEANKIPESKPVVTPEGVALSVEDKKADIEDRRGDALGAAHYKNESGEKIFTKRVNGKWVDSGETEKSVNAKYDAELSELEVQSTPQVKSEGGVDKVAEDVKEINVLSMLKESKILTPQEKQILYNQYKKGVMSETEISKYTNVDVADIKSGNTDKWANVVLGKIKGREIKAEEIDFEEIPQSLSKQESGATPPTPIAEAKQEGGEPPLPPPPKPPSSEMPEGDAMKELDKLANNVPDSGKIAEYMSKETIEKYTGETPTNDQTRGVQELQIALEHGEKIIEKAQIVFGKDYVDKTLDYIDNSTASVSNKALMYVSLENALGREKLLNPEKAADITKQQALVYEQSQKFARENSLALNYQKLRRIAKAGYDIEKVTDS
ncbi:MAG TPA: hypothetical protein VIY47_15850, partial [Ignavibacteriaceae bacterium]